MWNDLMSFVQRGYARIITFDLKSEVGQGLVEYSLIIALVSIALVVGLGALAGHIGDVFTSIGTTLEKA